MDPSGEEEGLRRVPPCHGSARGGTRAAPPRYGPAEGGGWATAVAALSALGGP
jgi:hypothetical protein